MTGIQIFAIPYDSGHQGKRMGIGPERFVEAGVDRMLGAAGHDTRLDVISVDDSFPTEIGTTFRLHRALAERVHEAHGAGSGAGSGTDRMPLVFAGNCGLASIGTVAGLRDPELGVIWFDAHGDFNTPETTTSGFLDGMPLAVITGRCWTALARSIPGFAPLSELNVMHIGGRDLDDAERVLLASSDVCVVTPERIGDVGIHHALLPALDDLAERVRRIYLHIDMDILDPSEAPANQFVVPGGLTLADLLYAIDLIGKRFRIMAAGIASYDPAYDPDERVLKAGLEIVKAIAEPGSL
jgi:arginase